MGRPYKAEICSVSRHEGGQAYLRYRGRHGERVPYVLDASPKKILSWNVEVTIFKQKPGSQTLRFDKIVEIVKVRRFTLRGALRAAARRLDENEQGQPFLPDTTKETAIFTALDHSGLNSLRMRRWE